MPDQLLGTQWIRPANDSKRATADPLVTFAVSTPATIAVAVDTRLGWLGWLDASWTDSGTQLTDFEGATTYRRFQIFTKDVPAGTVALGPAASGTVNANMYVVAVL